MYDVVVAGGGIAGLCCAREAARAGCSVLVLEAGREVGTPDHCGGLASLPGLQRLGLSPRESMSPHPVDSCRVSSPSGRSIEVRAPGGAVVALDRRQLDREAARQAAREGAEIRAGCRYAGRTAGGAATSAGEVECRAVVDARGAGALARERPGGAIPSAQFEVHAGWIRPGEVEVVLDGALYPGFFAWVIPSGEGRGRVGAAGRGIDPARALGSLLDSRGPHSVTRRVSAPVWVGGAAGRFRDGATLLAGDAAGQSKPTTAGGIFSCGMGGAMAGRAAAEYARAGSEGALDRYQAEWEAEFGREFAVQAAARRLLEGLDNAAIDGLLASVGPAAAAAASADGDFDFHAAAMVRMLGLRGSLGAARAVLGGAARGAARGIGARGKV